ncbi:hypothetical protein PGT21_028106 [Puccinia graminis f. sp. tritici]|uniref:Uncharacterized protein n=1 Tax=Puccinia graminis f. sp. tritici TaxID=56615 RepID=A0A5B0QXA8_PUCGR|nr:hypothetical protein PGT21_028106 [Puccinia graminis f. sp. tritici]
MSHPDNPAWLSSASQRRRQAKEEKKTSAPMEPTKRSSTPDAGPTVVVAPKQSITPNVFHTDAAPKRSSTPDAGPTVVVAPKRSSTPDAGPAVVVASAVFPVWNSYRSRR